MSALPPKADIRQRIEHVRLVPIADINHHLFSAVVIGLIRLFQFGGTVEIRPSTALAWLAQQLLQLFDLPSGLVVDYIAPRGRRPCREGPPQCREPFPLYLYISPYHRSGSGFVVEGREYVVTIFVGLNAAPVK